MVTARLWSIARSRVRDELSDAIPVEAGPDPSGRPFDRIVRIDGRSHDVLRLPGLRGGVVAPPVPRARTFVKLLDVLQYQVVHREARWMCGS